MLPDQLADDMIFEILTHASLEAVGRCRAVSRRWNEITYEPSFKDLHPRRTPTIAGYFVQGISGGRFSLRFVSVTGDDSPDLSLGFLPGPVRIEASDCGILLCKQERRDNGKGRYCVCKPSTKEWVNIPSPTNTDVSAAVTAMVVLRSRPVLRFKVLRISVPQGPSMRVHCCEVFDSEAWRWKRLVDMAVPREYFFIRESSVVVAGKAFWFTARRHILVFDMHEETWSTFPVPTPDQDFEQCQPPQLVKHEGKLGLLFQCHHGCFADLFVVENLGSRRWAKRERICFEGTGHELRRLLAIYSAKVILLQAYYKVLVCRSDGKAASVLKTTHIDVDEVFSFCSDL